MNTKEYHIKIYSISRFLIAIILIQVVIVIFLSDYISSIENRILSMITILGTFATSTFLSALIGQAKVKIVFTKEALLHIWEKRFLLSREKDVSIPWQIVENYVLEEDRTWDSFIINLSTKSRYKISRLNILPIKDDFDKLVKDFPRLSSKFKNDIESDNDTSLNLIEEGKSKYETKSFKQSFYVLLISFLILCIFKIVDLGSLTSLWSLGVIGSAIGYYWMMIKTKGSK